jgi:hypothetical protein
MGFGVRRVEKPAGKKVFPTKIRIVKNGQSGRRRLKVYPALDISFQAAYVSNSVLSFPYFLVTMIVSGNKNEASPLVNTHRQTPKGHIRNRVTPKNQGNFSEQDTTKGEPAERM